MSQDFHKLARYKLIAHEDASGLLHLKERESLEIMAIALASIAESLAEVVSRENDIGLPKLEDVMLDLKCPDCGHEWKARHNPSGIGTYSGLCPECQQQAWFYGAAGIVKWRPRDSLLRVPTG